jgi:1-acyl-sn-glycerol-3-phosphate acyltransferase
MGQLRGILRVVFFLTWVLVSLPFVFIFWAVKLDTFRARTTQLFYRVVSFIIGIRSRVKGSISGQRPLLLISNHTSYLDVFVLGSLVPVSFTPKKDVRSWPVIGFLCVLADCIFVERRPSEMQAAAAEMKQRLAKGKVLCIFPEGTTSDGYHVKPFKSGFLSLAETLHLPVQPASMAYTHIGRERITEARREEVAWVGDATFFGHFWHVLTLPSIHVEVELLEARVIDSYGDRKALTKACEVDIIQHVHALHEAAHAR